MPGPLPKETRQRERDTKRRSSEFVEVQRDGVLRGPTIAKATGRNDFQPGTIAWWDGWRRAPQAALFETTDWSALARIAPLVDAHLRRPSAAAAGEIRMTESALGGSYADRLRARIRVVEPTTADVVTLRSTGSRARDRFARPEEG